MKKQLLFIFFLVINFSALGQDCENPPSQVYISDITSSGATLNWTSPETENLGFQIFVYPTGAPVPTSTSIPTFSGMNGSTGPFFFIIPNGTLMADTAYDVYVRNDCEPTAVTSPVVTFTTTSTCPKPINLSVLSNSITTISANLLWTEASTATEWEVLLLPSTPDEPMPFPPADIPLGMPLYFQGLTTTTLSVNSLTPATIYYYYVRAVCGEDDRSIWNGPYIFNTITCDDTDKCQYKFILTDSGENGWNGARMQVRQNGIVVATLGPTFVSGGPQAINVLLCNDVPFDLYWNIAGTAPGEIGISIQDPFEDIVYEYVQGTGDPLTILYEDNSLGNCLPITCPLPTNLEVVSTTPTSAFLSWTSGGVENSWEIYVVPTTSSALPVDGSPVSGSFPYYIASTNVAFEVTNLIPDTVYTYYVRAICNEGGISIWTILNPMTFETQPGEMFELVAFIDQNSNSVKDSDETNFTYGSFTYQKNNTGDLTVVSSPHGKFKFHDPIPTNTYDFGYQINTEYDNYYALTPTNFDDLNIIEGSGIQYLYFPITITQEYSDVEVAIIPLSAPRPGFSYINKIVYKNKGIVPTSGTLTFTHDSNVTIATISQLGTVSILNGFTFDYSNLMPTEERYTTVSMDVPEIPIVNLNDILINTISSTIPNEDINGDNNDSTISRIVVGAYDPNDKNEAHGASIDFNSFAPNDDLTYTIRFQNTGTANAINVRIEDVLDAQLDETTVQMISASHDYVMERIHNKLIWTFEDIQLPPQITNEEASNGYVTFKIKPNEGFALGDMIPNFAEIYFDTNPAIITNTFTSTFEEQLATPEFTSGNLLMYPNPSNGMVYINTQNTTENLKEINLYDVLGKIILSTKNLSSKQSTLNIGSLAKGIYMVEINTENNFKQTKKLVVN